MNNTTENTDNTHKTTENNQNQEVIDNDTATDNTNINNNNQASRSVSIIVPTSDKNSDRITPSKTNSDEFNSKLKGEESTVISNKIENNQNKFNYELKRDNCLRVKPNEPKLKFYRYLITFPIALFAFIVLLPFCAFHSIRKDSEFLDDVDQFIDNFVVAVDKFRYGIE